MNTTEHLLSCLGEEGVEVALELTKLTSKANRFSLPDRNVLQPDGPTNAERLEDELNDLLAVVSMLVDAGAISLDWCDQQKQRAKREKVRRFLDYAKSKGALSENKEAQQAEGSAGA